MANTKISQPALTEKDIKDAVKDAWNWEKSIRDLK